MFDSYTVKKILPRLVAAVILIQLSWFIFTGVITLVNSIAYGVEGLIYASAGGMQNTSLAALMRGTSGGEGMFLTLTTVGVAGGIIAAIAIGGIMSTAMIVLLGVLIAFALLLFRQVMIVALLVVAPLAIVAWILPGTEKYWKIWWESFSKLLLVYPIILALVAIGRVMAKAVGDVDPQTGGYLIAGGGADLVNFFLVLACLFGPFFLIPKTFQMAGGAFSTLTGAVNNRGKGAFDRLRKRRAQTQAKNYGNFKAGSRFSERNALARRVNRVGMGVGAGAIGRFGLGARGQEATDLNSQASADEALKNNPKLQKLAFNDDANAVMALSGGSRRGAEQAADDLMHGWMAEDPNLTTAEAEARRDRALAAASAVGFSRQNTQAALTTMAQNKSRAVGAGNWGIIQEGIDRLAGNNRSQEENLRQNFQFHSRSNGRFDIGSSQAEQDQDSPNFGRHIHSNAAGGANRGSLYQIANAHPHTVQGWGNQLVDDLNNPHATPAQQAAATRNASIAHKELKAALPNATGETRDQILEQINRIERHGVPPGAPHGTPGTLANYDNTDVIDPATGAPRTRQQVERFDGARALADRAYDASWTGADKARGSRTNTVNVTNGDLSVEEARTYERPDPNHL